MAPNINSLQGNLSQAGFSSGHAGNRTVPANSAPVTRFNAVYKPLILQEASVKDLPGGRGRGGSHFISSHILLKLCQPDYYRGVIMREVHGDIRESIWREIIDRMEEQNYNPAHFEISEAQMRITHIATGNYVYAKGFRKSKGNSTAKLKSLAGCTHVYIDECEEIEETDFNQLSESLRTNKGKIEVFRVFNPPHKNHWIVKRYYELDPIEGEVKQDLLSRGVAPTLLEGYYFMRPKQIPGFLSVVSTYKHNEKNLSEDFVEKLESYGDPESPFYNLDRYLTVTLGCVSEGKKGRIYPNWKVVSLSEYKNIPAPPIFGLDFGYSNDPTALIEIKSYKGKIYLNEAVYRKGLTTPMLLEEMRAKGIPKTAPIYADSADPKSIAEIRSGGYKIIRATKGPKSVLAGIRHLQSLDISYTDTSDNIRAENENYVWHLDSEGKPTDAPTDKDNHAADAIRYALYRAKKGTRVSAR